MSIFILLISSVLSVTDRNHDVSLSEVSGHATWSDRITRFVLGEEERTTSRDLRIRRLSFDELPPGYVGNDNDESPEEEMNITQEYGSCLYGDINLDGKVNSFDQYCYQQYLTLGENDQKYCLEGFDECILSCFQAPLACVDVDCSNDISSLDSLSVSYKSSTGKFDGNVVSDKTFWIDKDYNNIPDCKEELSCVTPEELSAFPTNYNEKVIIGENLVLCPEEVYNIPKGIVINKDNVAISCQGAILHGSKGVDDLSLYSEIGVGIFINKKEGITIFNCTIENYDRGVSVINSTNFNFISNVVTLNGNTNGYSEKLWFKTPKRDSVFIALSSSSMFSNNLFIANNGTGLRIRKSEGFLISENVFYKNKGTGLGTRYLSYSNVTNNKMTENDMGMSVILLSKYNLVDNNFISNNKNGVLARSFSFNTFFNNTVTYNGKEDFSGGFYFKGSANSNEFIDNVLCFNENSSEQYVFDFIVGSGFDVFNNTFLGNSCHTVDPEDYTSQVCDNSCLLML